MQIQPSAERYFADRLKASVRAGILAAHQPALWFEGFSNNTRAVRRSQQPVYGGRENHRYSLYEESESSRNLDHQATAHPKRSCGPLQELRCTKGKDKDSLRRLWQEAPKSSPETSEETPAHRAGPEYSVALVTKVLSSRPYCARLLQFDCRRLRRPP